MKAEIIAVGTELLTGQIVNTNAQFLSQKMAYLGIDVYFQTAVGDNTNRLRSVLEIAQKRSDLVLICGGLGPTEDDLTKPTLAAFLECDLVVDLAAKNQLEAFFAQKISSTRTSNNDRQVLIVEGSTPLSNPKGLAVGGLITKNQVTYVYLPGPPSELEAMVNHSLVPLLKGAGKQLHSRVLRFFGIGESQLASVLADFIDKQTDPTIATYAKIGEVTLRLATKASTEAEADAVLSDLEEKLLQQPISNDGLLLDYFYGYGEDNSLIKETVQLLLASKKTITVAESLTGGLFQSLLVENKGISQVFSGGFITYSLLEKSKRLGIPLTDLKKHGVVSSFAAKKMALGAKEQLKTDLAISLTGVAGPDRLEGNPVGTVYLGLAYQDTVLVKKLNLTPKDRTQLRYISCLHAFDLLRKTLLDV